MASTSVQHSVSDSHKPSSSKSPTPIERVADMAKREVYASIHQVMAELDFDLSQHPALVDSTTARFYLDMTPVVPDSHVIARSEHRALRQMLRRGINRLLAHQGTDPSFNIRRQCGRDCGVSLVSEAYGGLFKASVHVRCGPDVDLLLLTTEAEAADLAAMTQFQPRKNVASPMLEKLPPELRSLIYTMIFSSEREALNVSGTLGDGLFLRALGDPTGFCCPLLARCPILSVNLATKVEALPLAYRCTKLQAHDVDDMVRILMAIGDIGRANAESIELTWQSAAEMSADVSHSPSTKEWLLPSWHASTCVRLLSKCKRLKVLCIRIDQDVLSEMPLDAFQQDSGITLLSSLQQFRATQLLSAIHDCCLRDLDGSTLKPTPTSRWLEWRLKSPSRKADLVESSPERMY